MSQLIGKAMAQPMPYLNQMVNSFNANIPRANPYLRNNTNQRPQNYPAHRQINNRNQVPFMQLPHRSNQTPYPRVPPASSGPTRRISHSVMDSVSAMNGSLTGNGYTPQYGQQISPSRRIAPYPDPQLTKFKHRGTRTSKKKGN
jgi:hypothetical protein